MDVRRYFNRKCFSVLLLVAAFVAISYIHETITYKQRHKTTIRKVGHFNQGTPQDVSSIYERQATNSTDAVNILQALRHDGFHPRLLSRFCENRTATRSAEKTATFMHRSHVNNSGASAKTLVPNVVHYVFMGFGLQFTFIHYLSFLSVERFMKPELILLHGNRRPVGYWWNITAQQVKNIYHVRRPYMDTAPNGKTLRYPAHAADYIRLDALLRYGGIYLDGDVLALKSFEPLLNYSAVVGRETYYGLCNGILVAQRGAPFLRLMLEQYRSYRGMEEEWAEKSVENTHRLMKLYPHLVHVEETSLNRPNWDEKVQIYHYNYDWSGNYAMHLWVRAWPEVLRPSGLEDVLTLDSTFGEMARSILFGLDKSHKNVSISTSRPIIIGLLLQL